MADEIASRPCTVGGLTVAIMSAVHNALGESDGDRQATMADLGGVLMAIQRQIQALRFCDEPRLRQSEL